MTEPEQIADTVRWDNVRGWDRRGGAFVHSRHPYSNEQLLKALQSWAINERERYASEPSRSGDKITYGYRACLLEAVGDLLASLLNDGDGRA